MNPKDAVEYIDNKVPNLSKISFRFYKGKTDNYYHLCYIMMAYEKLIKVPPESVIHLFGIVGENDDGRLACKHCGACLPKSIDMAIRLLKLNV